MFEIDPFTLITVAHEIAQTVALVGPPADLPAQVPEFVGDLLGAIGSMAGNVMEGIGETVRALTPGNSSGAETAPGR